MLCRAYPQLCSDQRLRPYWPERLRRCPLKASKSPNAKLVSAIVTHAVQNGLIVESAGSFSNVICFPCPLVVTDAQLERGLDILESTIEFCTSQQ